MIVMTRGINDRIADDASFAEAVVIGLGRFGLNDWGEVDPEDRKLNDADALSIANGGEGRILAAYGSDDDKFWIIKEPAATTILFPSEY